MEFLTILLRDYIQWLFVRTNTGTSWSFCATTCSTLLLAQHLIGISVKQKLMCNVASTKLFLDSIIITPYTCSIAVKTGNFAYRWSTSALSSRINFSRLADSGHHDEALKPKKSEPSNLRTLVLGTRQVPQCRNMCIQLERERADVLLNCFVNC